MTRAPPNPRSRRPDLPADFLLKESLEVVLAQVPERQYEAGREHRILAAALLECAERGVANVTIADVAKRAKSSTATIYAKYKNRDALVSGAIASLIAVLPQGRLPQPRSEDPIEQLAMMLHAHGLIYSQPLAAWLMRLYVSVTWSGQSALRESGAAVFARIDGIWREDIADMVTAGALAPIDVDHFVPLILAPIERWTLLCALGGGPPVRADATLADVALHTARLVFAVWGTDAVWERRGESRPALAPLAETRGAPWRGPHPSSLDPSPAQRLHALVHEAGAPSPQQRRERILLAAALEGQQHGYTAASVQDIATRAEVGVATVYKHFGDKAGLFEQLLAVVCAPDEARAPQADIAGALVDGAALAAAPERGWLLALRLTSELSVAPGVVMHNQRLLSAREAEWDGRLDALAGAAGLSAQERLLAINFLLGGVERASVYACLVRGEGGVDTQTLAGIARLAEDIALRVFGPAQGV